MLTDMHTHSNFSPDAQRDTSIDRMAARAEEMGLEYIAVTDHCDCNYWLPSYETDYLDYQQGDGMMFGSRDYALGSIERTSELKEKYPHLLCGIELGQLMQAPDIAARVASDDRLDFIIGSLHMNRGKQDFYWIKYNELDSCEVYRLLDNYFTEELETCKAADFDVLGHLTYPLRYMAGDYSLNIDMSRYQDVIREIFCTLIKRGKGIEVNTSGYRQKYGKPFPDLEYLKLYRSLGGEIITLGSDSHRISDIGAGISEGEDLLRSAGFRYISVFKKRSPEFIALK